MDTTITYDTILGLLANPPSLGSRPNFFNLRELRLHYARALKKVPCPQSAINGWSGAVLAPAMYALIDTKRFHWNISAPTIPQFPARFVLNDDGTNGAEIPYTRDEIFTITATHERLKNYHDTGTNVCRAFFDSLDAHVGDEFKSPPANAQRTIGWNSTMLPNDMLDQLMLTYGKPTPDAVRQNNATFFAAYNPRDPPEVLFKRIADCQEIAIVAKVPFTDEQLLMNAVDLFTRCGLYTRDMDDWERKLPTEQTYFNLRPFIQSAYQHRITSGTVTTSASGYGTNNRFAGLSAEDDVSDDGTAETIVASIDAHMANLSASVLTQSSASNDANTTVFNAAIQQMAANEAQRNADHARMMEQFAMMSTNTNTAIRPTAATHRQIIPTTIPVLQSNQWTPPNSNRGTGSRSRGGNRGRRAPPRQSVQAPFPASAAVIPYIPGGVPPSRFVSPRYSNVVKRFANQNVCFSCGFDVEDWHNSATCNNKKQGHQDGFTRSNYKEYERANHDFCRKAMHKTMYPVA
jgi:hypothetical protein